MKLYKIILLLSLILIISSTTASAISSYHGSFNNPVSAYMGDTNTGLEYTVNSKNGQDSYVYAQVSCAFAPWFNEKYITCHLNPVTLANIECNACNIGIPFVTNYTDITTTTPLSASTNGVRFTYNGTAGLFIYPTTTGTAAPLPLDNSISIFQNDYSEDIEYANQTHIGTATGSITIPSEVSGNVSKVDSYKNNSFLILGGSDNRTVYHIQSDGTYINQYSILSNTVITTPRDIYAIGNYAYIVTDNTIYNYSFDKYFFSEGIYYSPTQCMYDNVNNEWNICNNTQFYDDTIYLNYWCQFDVNESLSDSQRCNSDCTTLTGYDLVEEVSYEYGECGIPSCQDECSFNGYQTCNSQTSYLSCGQYDGDECLELSGSIQCLTNQQCLVTGSSNYGECQDINFTSYGTTISYPSYSLSAGTTNTDNTFYSIESNKRVNVDTKFNTHTQNFTLQTLSVGTSLYQAKSCTYQDNFFFSDYLINTDLSQTGWTPSTYDVITYEGSRYIDLNDTNALTKLYSETNHNPLIRTAFIPNIDNTTNVSAGIIRNGNNFGYGASIYFIRSSNNKSIKFYEANSTHNNITLLFEDISTNTYDDLEVVTIETRMNYEIFQVDYYISLTRSGVNTSYQVTPLNITNVQTASDRIQYQMINGTMYINYVDGLLDEVLPSYYLATLGTGAVQCTYTHTGCYTARIYVNGNTVPVFNNYKDTVICVNSLGNSQAFQSNTGFIDMITNLTLAGRLLTVILSLMATLLIIIVPAALMNVEHIGLFFGIAGFFALVELILFVVIGLMPGWILLLMFVLGGGLIALATRKTVMGA